MTSVGHDYDRHEPFYDEVRRWCIGIASTEVTARPFDVVMNTGGPYTYDSLGRVKSFTSNAGATTSYTWTYDR